MTEMHPGLTTLVVPTLGRPSLRVLLNALAAQTVPMESPVILVDDRPDPADPLPLGDVELEVRVVRSGGAGPAAARNRGWRAAHTPWVSFLDDDIVPVPDWYEALLEDIESVPAEVMGTQGQLSVPLPTGRRPTDWERSTAGLEGALWISADLTVRRAALAAVGGFDERFRRAYREDVDLALRITQRLGGIELGSRYVSHPPRPSGFWASVRSQAGNADDMLMLRLHGPEWHRLSAAPYGRRWLHVAIAGSGVVALLATLTGRRRLARLAGATWAAGTAEFAARRILPGPRDRDEVARMVVTSAAIPFAAAWHTARGLWRHRDVQLWRGLPDLVLFDRDGTLIRDVPYNGDPAKVELVPEAAEAVDLLRARGVPVGIVTNQSGIARGLITKDAAEAVNDRVADLLGPFAVTEMCPHADGDGCDCRKPEPGMVLAACEKVAADPERTVVIGDTDADVEAARAAGAVGILVPNAATDPSEPEAAPLVASSLADAVELALSPLDLWSAGSAR